jgi:hypothetical protein
MSFPIIAPTPIGNRCIGQNSDGSVNAEFRCVKMTDVDGTRIYNCVGMRFFLVTCPAVNQLCSTTSGAYVAAVTCCNQGLFN